MHERDSMDRSMLAKLEKGQPMSNLESHEKTATRPLTGTVPPQSPLSRIARRTLGQSHGPITRLMSPSDFGGTEGAHWAIPHSPSIVLAFRPTPLANR